MLPPLLRSRGHLVASRGRIAASAASANARRMVPLSNQLAVNLSTEQKKEVEKKPIKRIMAANRGEIALRIFRACTELGISSVGIFSKEDSGQIHRLKADMSFPLDPRKGPVEAYLDIDYIVNVARANNVDAIHPGYGFLSERSDFARACADAGIRLIGPAADVMARMGDKVAARQTAIAAGLPIIPGTDDAVTTPKEARAFCEQHGVPVIFKAAFGGGGRGMRVVKEMSEVEDQFERAQSEALSAFGNGEIFIEKLVTEPRHIEVQIIGDHQGNIVHFYERDCSVQRRHQKVVELAPAPKLPPEVREKMLRDAVHLCKSVGYTNAGTVEFLYEPATGKHYFMEVNARLQVEHTVTEEITGVDLVHTQIRVAEGNSLPDLGLAQEQVRASGYAIQCRLTTEDPNMNFAPDFGTIDVYRPAEGFGIRCDGGNIFPGATINPHYDSLLVKVISKSNTLENTILKMKRALAEFRIRGVKTNVPFLMNVIQHPTFVAAETNTSFIDQNQQLFALPPSRNRAQKVLNYLANTMVNGPSTPLVTPYPPSEVEVTPPGAPEDGSYAPGVHGYDPYVGQEPPKGLRSVLLSDGPEAFAKAVLDTKGLLLTDTTLRDAHQSLLATRMRTHDMLKISPFLAHNFSSLYSLENWGGATFDVAMRFLHECPWERLQQMRALVPNIPFQMLLRGANTVGYTSYPDNVLFKFCDLAVKNGMDIFRVFDSLNYMPNMIIGMDAVGKAGGVIEAAISYTGDVADPSKTKYDLNYYVDLADQLVRAGAHVLCIKDMAGLLTPRSSRLLVDAIKQRHPDVPLHIHTHDTAMVGVASMLECAAAGADVVDVAADTMSGMTSQPAMGSVVNALRFGDREVEGVEREAVDAYNTFWEATRPIYAPFECTQTLKSGNSDVVEHEIPGGQYTNLQFQAFSMGMAGEFATVKQRYKEANEVLGDIVKVTPSSKVVGDLAQYMVSQKLTKQDLLDRAEELKLPASVVEFLQGYIGQPHGGFPEPFRSQVLKDLPRVDGRPGESLPPCDFDEIRRDLESEFGPHYITEEHVVSAALYPKVTRDYLRFRDRYGPVDKLDTKTFLVGPTKGKEIRCMIEHGKWLDVTCVMVADSLNVAGERELHFLMNGQRRSVSIKDESVQDVKSSRPKAEFHNPEHVGAPVRGDLIELKVKVGDEVARNQSVGVLSSMKMETVLVAKQRGRVAEITAKEGDPLEIGDLVIRVELMEE